MNEHSEHWMQRIVDRLDRLIEIGERLEGQVRLPSEEEAQTFADAKEPAKEPPKKWRILEPGEEVQEGDWVNAKSNLPSDPPNGRGWTPATSDGLTVLKSDGCIFARPVSDEPAKEPEHSEGPMPDPGEGYRILSKNPPEELMPGDELQYINGTWIASDNARTHRRQGLSLWYRRKIEQPEPAWEPKVGDWVKVTRPEDWVLWRQPRWEGAMNQFDKKIGKIECEWGDCFQICGFAAPNGFRYQFHRDWLSHAEPPKPPQPEYREPVLPADFDRRCDFSSDGIEWRNGYLRGYVHSGWRDTNGVCWPCCRIKKDA